MENSKEKKVEEMAKIMLEASTSANVEPVLEMEGKKVVLGENATKILDNILEQAYIPFLAEVLYTTGYRLASDVAREICAEIGERFKSLLEMLPADGALTDAKTFIEAHWEFIENSIVSAYDAELKNKYTEGEG